MEESTSLNFALILFFLLLLTFVAWLADRFVFLPRRKALARTRLAEFDAAQGGAPEGQRSARDAEARAAISQAALRQPIWLEYTAGLFPVIAVVFFLRSFLVEPFKIPSGSMIPTLLVGDLILVNKFSYGVRLPVINKSKRMVGMISLGDVGQFATAELSAQYVKSVSAHH